MFAVASKEKAIDIYSRSSSGQGNTFRRCAVLKGHAVSNGCSRVTIGDSYTCLTSLAHTFCYISTHERILGREEHTTSVHGLLMSSDSFAQNAYAQRITIFEKFDRCQRIGTCIG
jgi:hypothetical protein